MPDLSLHRLHGDASPYASLTFPAYRPLLAPLRPGCCAIAATRSGRVVGLALGRLVEGAQQAEVLSLFVQPEGRGQGIGTALLAELEQAAREAGAVVASVVYTRGKPAIAALERVLAKRRWADPLGRMVVFQADLARMSEAPWLARAEQDPAFEVFAWAELAPEDEQSIARRQAREAWIPEDLTPWRHHDDFEPHTSLGLRHAGEVVGWVITHRISAEVLRFSSGFVHPVLQRRGRLIILYAEAGRRAIAQGFARATWTVPLRHEAKVAFARRWMAPYARSCEESMGSVKWLVESDLVVEE